MGRKKKWEIPVENEFDEDKIEVKPKFKPKPKTKPNRFELPKRKLDI